MTVGASRRRSVFLAVFIAVGGGEIWIFRDVDGAEFFAGGGNVDDASKRF